MIPQYTNTPNKKTTLAVVRENLNWNELVAINQKPSLLKKPKPGNPGSFFPGDAGEEREEHRVAGGLRERGLDFGGEARAEEPKRPKSARDNGSRRKKRRKGRLRG